MNTLRNLATQFSYRELSKKKPEVLQQIQQQDPELFHAMLKDCDQPISAGAVEQPTGISSVFFKRFAGKTLVQVAQEMPEAVALLRSEHPGQYRELSMHYANNPLPAAGNAQQGGCGCQSSGTRAKVGASGNTSFVASSAPAEFSVEERRMPEAEALEIANDLCKQLTGALKKKDYAEVARLQQELVNLGPEHLKTCGIDSLF